MKILPLQINNYGPPRNFKANNKKDTWEDPIDDTFKTALVLGILLNDNYFLSFKGDSKTVKVGKFMVISALIGDFIYESIKKIKNHNVDK